MIKVTLIENGKKIEKIVEIGNAIGKSSTLDKMGLVEIPLSQLSSLREVENQIEEICCICQFSFEVGTKKRVLRCNHFFHDSCIEKWLTDRIKCPLCSKEIA
jgi:hypothetical protein